MNPSFSRRTFLAAAGAAGAVRAQSAAGGWRAGVARTAITPREPVWLAGYGARNKPGQGALHDIWVKALALQDAGGGTSVVVTSDLLGFSRPMAAAIAGRVEKKYGIARERLALTSSHTHSAPVTGDVLRPAYEMRDEHVKAVERYTAELLDKVVDTVGAAVKDLAPADLAFAHGQAGFAVNRRSPEFPRPVDHDVPVLAVRSGGKLRAVVFGYACHATVLSGYEVSGDWPGFAQIAIEKQFPGAAALFVAGCGADANPLPRRKVELADTYGRIMMEAVSQALEGRVRPLAPSLKPAFAEAELLFQTPPTRQQLQGRLSGPSNVARHARYLLDMLERDGRLPDRHAYPIQVWRLGGAPGGVTWIVLGGEVVVDYALRFKRQYGMADTWVSGYSNDVFAYIPSVRVLKEGGYEGDTSMIPYGQPGPWRAMVEETIAETVDDLVRRTR